MVGVFLAFTGRTFLLILRVDTGYQSLREAEAQQDGTKDMDR
jgi:hypothetical protein